MDLFSKFMNEICITISAIKKLFHLKSFLLINIFCNHLSNKIPNELACLLNFYLPSRPAILTTRFKAYKS